MAGSVRRWVQSGNFVPLVVLLVPVAVLSAYSPDRIFTSHASEIRGAISYLGVIVGVTLAGTSTGMYILRLKWNTLVHFAQEHGFSMGCLILMFFVGGRKRSGL